MTGVNKTENKRNNTARLGASRWKMLSKLLFISLALLLVSSVLGFTQFNKPVLASHYTIDENAKQQILAATVRITLFAPITDAQGQPQYVTMNGQKAIQYTVGEGLGTLTRSGEDVFVVTHDHWTLLTENLHKVQFHNVANDLILEVSGDAFRQLIRYRDGGTTVLTAPAKLKARLTATEMGNGRSVQNNDILLTAYRAADSGAISVAAMRVEKTSVFQGQPIYRMINMNGDSVIGGNSGGGVWANGQLVGNMWTTTMEQKVSRLTGKAVSQMTQTSTSLAAQLPVEFAQ